MGVNNNVAILSLMTKLDEKSVERVASQLGKTTEEAMSDISSNIAATFSEEMVTSLKKALELASGKLKGVNLSSYTGNLLDSLFSEKDVDAKKKDLEKFIRNITNLSKSLTGLNPNSLNSMNTKQLDTVIEKQEKILAKEQEIADKRNDLEKTAGNIASKKNSLRTITQNYSTSDYTKSNEELKKLFATENKFDKAQEKSIKHLAQMLTLYSDMEKVQPQKGTSDAIKYSTDLLTIVREIQKTSKQVDLFTGGKATEYITKNLSSMSKVTPYGIELSKQDYVKNGLKSLTTQKTSLEKSLITYIVDIVQKNLQKTSDQANKVLDQAENRAEKLQTKFDNLKGGTSSQKPIVGDIVDESQLKSLDEIESRLYEIYDKDAEGNANTKELKEYINLYKQYENLIASDSTRKFDPNLKDEYNVIVNTSKAMREYADSIQIVSSEQKKMAGTENVGDSGDSNERTEQLREQEQQADKTAAAEKGLSEAQQESLETIQQDLDQAKEKINDLATRMSNLEDNNSFTDLSEQVKGVTSDIGILADKVNALFDSLKSTKEINALDVLMHGGNLDVLNNSSYQRSDALLKNLRNIFSGTSSDYGMVTGGGIFGTNDMSGIAKTDVSPNSKWYAIDFSKYHTYMVETEEEAEKLNQFMQGLNLAVIKNLGVNGEYIAPSFKDMYEDINVDALYQEYKNSFKGANLSLEEFKTTVDELADYIKKAGFELYDDDEYSYTGKNARVSEEHAYDKDISTMFYEKHGYEGINFNKLRDQHYNGYVYGSTIFNIDKNNPYFKVFDTYEEAVEYMGQISNKIDNNQTIFYDYIDKSNSKFKQDLEQVNALLQEQSRLIDEIRNKTSNSGVPNTDSSKINPIEKVDNESNISSGSTPAAEQQNKLQEELRETEVQAGQTAQAVREVGHQDQMKDAFQGETGSGNGLVNEAENLNEKLEKSKQYVNEVQQAFMNIVGRTSNRNELLTQYPELSEFKNRKSVDKARSFLNTDDWKDFLSTLPEAHAYLESIGYDFDRIYKLSDEEINWFKGLDADTILQKGWNQDKNGAPSKEDYKEIRAAYQAAMQSIVQPEDTIEAEEKLDEVVQEEAASMDKIEEAAKGATQAKKDFAAANGIVQTSIDGSKTPLELEAELMERIAESARKAADAKKEFVEANKQVADSANESDSDLQTGHSENAEPTGVKKYKKRGYRAKSKGTQDNEIKVEGGKTLEQALRESQDKVKSGLNANVDIIKEITDFYDSNDNLVKTQMKVVNAETKRQSTYTTSYSTDKDGNATAWTSHIDTNKIADREKQEAKEIQAEWKKNTDAIEAYMNAVTKLNNLKTVDKGTGKYSNQIELQIQKVEELRQVAYAARANLSSMINPHDMDIIDWNKWLEAMKQFGQASQGSAESVAKLEDALRNVKTSTLNSVQSTIDTYEQKLNDFSNIPAGFDQSTAYKNNIESLTNAINTLKTYKEQLATQDTISNDDLNQIKEYEQDIKKTTSAITSMSAAEKGSTALGRDKLYNKIGDYLKRNSSMSKQFRQELEGLQRQLTTLGGDANVASLTDEFVKLQSRIREAKQEGKTFWDVIKEKAWYGLASQIGMYFGLNDFIRYIREGIDVVTELDTALTEMRKVSDETVTSLKAYQETTFDVADAVGTTAVQIQNSTADFMRLGESMDEAAESAKTANILMNVSEFESIDDATSALTSMAQAYQDLDKMTIVDKLNEVGKIIAQTYSNVWCYKNIAW